MLVKLVLVLLGLSGGIAVGTALVAFLIVLDIVPRLVQASRTRPRIRAYEWALVLGALFWTVVDFFDVKIPLVMEKVFVPLVGGFTGAFVGLLAAALTEVINVIPVLSRRLKMERHLVALLMAMVLGKMFGSLYHWLIFLKP